METSRRNWQLAEPYLHRQCGSSPPRQNTDRNADRGNRTVYCTTVTFARLDQTHCATLCGRYSRKMPGHRLIPKDCLIRKKIQRCSSCNRGNC